MEGNLSKELEGAIQELISENKKLVNLAAKVIDENTKLLEDKKLIKRKENLFDEILNERNYYINIYDRNREE